MTLKHFVLAGTAIVAVGLTQATAARPVKPEPVGSLIRAVNLPFETFTLANGLRVIVHTDRSAPLVTVHVKYDVGSKFEPKGRSGFAHLFEHLMFTGSENAPEGFFAPLKAVGVTSNNGSTGQDQTSYYETVPTPALQRVLFLESDRMGHLLGSLTQTRLDEQRAVVKNEKRQKDNQPGGLVNYWVTDALYPADHPYGHTVIGSMADLDAATLEDVKNWFRNHYGPNNAVVTLAGDIDVATARTLMQTYFGDIPAGPRAIAPVSPIPTLPRRLDETKTDQVSATLLARAWAIPGRNDPDSIALEAAAGLMAGLGNAPLQEILVRKEKLFTGIGAGANLSSQSGVFMIRAEVANGVDPALAGRRLDEEVAAFLRRAPGRQDLVRYVTLDASNALDNLDSVSDRAAVLTDGALLNGHPGEFKDRLVTLAAETPEHIRTIAARWLSRPVYALTLAPGPRLGYVESVAIPVAAVGKKAAVATVTGTRGPLPSIGASPDLQFPAVSHTRLSNGIEVTYAQRVLSPLSYVSVEFDAGIAADRADALGTQNMLLALLDKGTTTRSQIQFASALEALGGRISVGASKDRTIVTLVVPPGNVSPAMELLGDMVRHPALAPDQIALQRTSQLAAIAQEALDPRDLGQRVIKRLVNPASPYAKDQGSGDATAVAALTRDDLLAFHAAWIRPDKARIFVVSNRPLSDIQPILEQRLADWQATGAGGIKDFSAPARPAVPQVVLIDRPDSTQAMVLAGQFTNLRGSNDLNALDMANDALGGTFTSRLNQELRERRGWTYGISSRVRNPVEAVSYTIAAPVQSDRAGASISAIREIVTHFATDQPITPTELSQAVGDRVRSLPSEISTTEGLLNVLRSNALYHRPDDYYAQQQVRLGALTVEEARRTFASVVDPAKFVWVVVGDATKVKPQLEALGLPLSLVPASAPSSH